MCDKRKKLIAQAVLNKLSPGPEFYTADDILVAADISDQKLQELLKQFQDNVAEITRKEK